MKEEESEKEERKSNTTIRTAISGQNLFWPCDEKRETRTSCDNRNDCRKTASKVVEWTNKVAQSRTRHRSMKAMRDRDAWKVMTAHAEEYST